MATPSLMASLSKNPHRRFRWPASPVRSHVNTRSADTCRMWNLTALDQSSPCSVNVAGTPLDPVNTVTGCVLEQDRRIHRDHSRALCRQDRSRDSGVVAEPLEYGWCDRQTAFSLEMKGTANAERTRDKT
ncbi:unnamed protein product [Rangifer tarandus platyrhynchus]|uniref:Uncharacterized protein n=1 Tax=Rangifer tarandus platyrhynchus TaxID=3082113 RepID=A0AC59YG24_RANTA